MSLCILLAACGSTPPASSAATPDISENVIPKIIPSPSESAVIEPEVSEPEISEPVSTESETIEPTSPEPENTENVAEYPDPPVGGDGITTLKVLQKFWTDFALALPIEEKIAATYEDVAKLIGTDGLLSFPVYAQPGHAYYKWVAPSEESIFLDFKVRDDGVYYFFNAGATGIIK